jgi:DNA-binding MurR/RpiR family transcriptional regulator
MTPPMRVTNEAELRRLVLDAYDALPPQQQLVATHIIDNLREAPLLTAQDIATRTGVSEATIVRFAKSLGYSGYSALRSNLLVLLREEMFGASAEREASEAARALPDTSDTLGAVARLEVANIGKTVEDLDRATFRRAAERLVEGGHTFVYGLGISSPLARLTAYLLTEIGVRATSLSTSFSSPLEQLVTVEPTDRLVVFSFPPYSRQTVDLVREASERGVPALAICDRPTSPAAMAAETALAVRSENMMFTNAFAAVAVLLNALIIEVALLRGDRAAAALGKITDILAGDDNILEDGSR